MYHLSEVQLKWWLWSMESSSVSILTTPSSHPRQAGHEVMGGHTVQGQGHTGHTIQGHGHKGHIHTVHSFQGHDHEDYALQGHGHEGYTVHYSRSSWSIFNKSSEDESKRYNIKEFLFSTILTSFNLAITTFRGAFLRTTSPNWTKS